jgi:2-polyprenyl-6-methoxyphenol hydroxylase-like FAD-dependent oxidoreductase
MRGDLTAVVVGRSMAGLAAAAALTRHFDNVIVIDKDADHESDQPRPGVGQGHHYHALSQGGLHALERLLPGFTAELRGAGAVDVPFALGVRFYDAGAWSPNRDLGFTALNSTRGLIEQVVYMQLRAHPRAHLRGSSRLARLLFEHDGRGENRVCGVELRRADGALESLEADLVVDCTGRLSKVPEVLMERGLEPIPQFVLNIGISYTSALFSAPADAADGFPVVVVLPEPPRKRGGFAARVRDDTWICFLAYALRVGSSENLRRDGGVR